MFAGVDRNAAEEFCGVQMKSVRGLRAPSLLICHLPLE
jgi:hypothetical protein